jgi:DNA-binding MarR family transcriptional regulator
MEASEQYRLLMADVYELAGLSRRTSEAIAKELGQTVARWHVLSVLSAGPCTVPATARRLGLTRQGVQRVADDLLAARLLTASPNPDHARSPLLTLTNRGQLVLEQLTQRSDAARGRLLHQAHITAEDLEAARTTLRALLQSLATSDWNFRPGIPATGAGLPVNDRMFGDVADHGVHVAAFGVQVGAGVVFGDAPDAEPLVPAGGPLRVVREATADPFGISGRRQDGHAHLTRRAWPP